MSAHTPGPWKVDANEGENILIYADGGNCLIAIVETENVDDLKYARADARLIAAAPRMLEWLKDYVSRASDINPLKRSALDILKEIELCGEKSDGH